MDPQRGSFHHNQSSQASTVFNFASHQAKRKKKHLKDCTQKLNVGIRRESGYIYSQSIGKAGLQVTPNYKGKRKDYQEKAILPLACEERTSKQH